MIQVTKSALIFVERSGFPYSVLLFPYIKFPKCLGTHLSGISKCGPHLKGRWAKGDGKAHRGGSSFTNKGASLRNWVGLVATTRVSLYCCDCQAGLWWWGKSIGSKPEIRPGAKPASQGPDQQGTRPETAATQLRQELRVRAWMLPPSKDREPPVTLLTALSHTAHFCLGLIQGATAAAYQSWHLFFLKIMVNSCLHLLPVYNQSILFLKTCIWTQFL